MSDGVARMVDGRLFHAVELRQGMATRSTSSCIGSPHLCSLVLMVGCESTSSPGAVSHSVVEYGPPSVTTVAIFSGNPHNKNKLDPFRCSAATY